MLCLDIPIFTVDQPEQQRSECDNATNAVRRAYADVVDYTVNSIQMQFSDLPYSVGQIPGLQTSDSLLDQVRLTIDGNTAACAKCGPHRKYLPEIVLVDETLYISVRDSLPSRLLVTKAMGLNVLKHLHDDILTAHLGYKRTLMRACDRMFWQGMTKDIFDYV